MTGKYLVKTEGPLILKDIMLQNQVLSIKTLETANNVGEEGCWIVKKSFWSSEIRCGLCECTADAITDFCPHCGARLTGKVVEGDEV